MTEQRRITPARLVGALLAMVLVVLAVAAVGEWLLVPSAAVQDLDAAVLARAHGWLAGRPGLIDPAIVWAVLSGPWLVHPLVVVVAATLVGLGVARRRALLTAVVGLVGSGLAAWCKLLVARPRPEPDDPITLVAGWSYPSGHATNVALGAVLLVVLLQVVPVRWVRRVGVALVLLGTVLTGLDRLVLGVHYLSDVLAGYVLGTAMALVGLVVLRCLPADLAPPDPDAAPAPAVEPAAAAEPAAAPVRSAGAGPDPRSTHRRR